MNFRHIEAMSKYYNPSASNSPSAQRTSSGLPLRKAGAMERVAALGPHPSALSRLETDAARRARFGGARHWACGSKRLKLDINVIGQHDQPSHQACYHGAVESTITSRHMHVHRSSMTTANPPFIYSTHHCFHTTALHSGHEFLHLVMQPRWNAC